MTETYASRPIELVNDLSEVASRVGVSRLYRTYRMNRDKKRTAENHITDAIAQEDHVDRAEMAKVYAVLGCAERVDELTRTLRQTNRLLAAQLIVGAGGALDGQMPESVTAALEIADEIAGKRR